MKFAENKNKVVDYTTLEKGSVANATLRTFRCQSGFWFGTCEADGETVSVIIGASTDYKITDLMPMKGMEVTIVFNGTKVVDGKTFPRYSIEF